MQIPKVKNLTAKIVLSFLILWGAASFFVFPTLPVFQWVFLLISIFVAYFAIVRRYGYLVFIIITFSNSYSFYGLQSVNGIPSWLVLIGLAIVLALTFWFLGRQLVLNDENYSLVLTFFLISMLEIYLALSFWLINPLTKSLMMGIFAYLFAGYLMNISNDRTFDKKFYSYIYTAVIVLAILIFTVSWGR